MKKCMRALGVALVGAAVCAGPALAAGDSLSPATFHRLAVAAIADYEKTTREAGTPGLRQKLELCYPKAVATHSQALAASCIMRDRFATQVQVGLFPNMPEDYFTDVAFARRAAATVDAVVPAKLASGFIAALASSEDAAAYRRMLALKAGSGEHFADSGAAQ